MAAHSCHNCVYSVCDQERWLRLMWLGEPILPRCANHPQWPGQLREVPGVPCRNYQPRPALPETDVRLIPLGDGFYAYVDAADYEWLSRYNWRVVNGYACRHEKNKSILMHREITQAPKGKVVDHIDANKLNNCRFNLRVCTAAENQFNQRKRRGSYSQFKGVQYRKKQRRFYVECRFAGTKHWLGFFDDEIEAARAYDRKAVELHGEYARVNFPEEWPPERRAQVHAQRDAAKKQNRKRRTEDGRQRTGGTKEGKSRKARRGTGHKSRSPAPQGPKGKKPHAETPGRSEAKRTKKAGKSKGKNAKAALRAAGGTRRSRKGKTQNARRKTRRKAAGRRRQPRTGN